MPGPIRNTCAARGSVTVTGQSLLYTVPANNQFILKFVGLYNGASAASTVLLFGYAGGANPGQVVTQQLSLPASTSNNWSGWTVLNAGDQIYMQTSQQPLYYWIAGALLPFA